jgi:hypothetical protein
MSEVMVLENINLSSDKILYAFKHYKLDELISVSLRAKRRNIKFSGM